MRYLVLGLAAVLINGCAGGVDEVDQSQSPTIGANGLRTNGLRTNGLRTNGLRTNGLRTNGLRTNGLESDHEFSAWFNNADGGDKAGHANFMKYVVACAVPASQAVTYTDSANTSHVWSGSLGLAPGWLSGLMTAQEEGWMSACLLAHVNSNGATVQISVRGSHPNLGTTPTEIGTLGSFAGAFFGDVFSESGKYYACSTPEMRSDLAVSHSMLQTVVRDQGRECAIDGCAGTFTVVDCNAACGGLPASSCSHDGQTFGQVINVFVPNYRAAAGWVRSSQSQLPYETTCNGCLNKQALDFWRAGAGTTASATAFTLAGTGGNFSMVIRYSNGSNAPLNLKVQVNGVTIKNGSSDFFTFAPTGGWDTWSTRTVSFAATSAPTVKLVGGGSSKKGPKVDVAWVQLQ